MANVLNTDKQIGVISALAEGSSIRSIERITGVHPDYHHGVMTVKTAILQEFRNGESAAEEA